MYERPCRPREYAAVLGLPSREHATRQHANLSHGCPLQTTDSDEYGGPAPFSEAEARIIKLIAEDSPLRSFVNMHSGEYALYAPWDSQQKLAVGQPVGPGFFMLAAAAASENSVGQPVSVGSLWPLMLPGGAHCGMFMLAPFCCSVLLLLVLPSSWYIGYMQGSAHAVFCCQSLISGARSQQRALCAGWSSCQSIAAGLRHVSMPEGFSMSGHYT